MVPTAPTDLLRQALGVYGSTRDPGAMTAALGAFGAHNLLTVRDLLLVQQVLSTAAALDHTDLACACIDRMRTTLCSSCDRMLKYRILRGLCELLAGYVAPGACNTTIVCEMLSALQYCMHFSSNSCHYVFAAMRKHSLLDTLHARFMHAVSAAEAAPVGTAEEVTALHRTLSHFVTSMTSLTYYRDITGSISLFKGEGMARLCLALMDHPYVPFETGPDAEEDHRLWLSGMIEALELAVVYYTPAHETTVPLLARVLDAPALARVLDKCGPQRLTNGINIHISLIKMGLHYKHYTHFQHTVGEDGGRMRIFAWIKSMADWPAVCERVRTGIADMADDSPDGPAVTLDLMSLALILVQLGADEIKPFLKEYMCTLFINAIVENDSLFPSMACTYTALRFLHMGITEDLVTGNRFLFRWLLAFPSCFDRESTAATLYVKCIHDWCTRNKEFVPMLRKQTFLTGDLRMAACSSVLRDIEYTHVCATLADKCRFQICESAPHMQRQPDYAFLF